MHKVKLLHEKSNMHEEKFLQKRFSQKVSKQKLKKAIVFPIKITQITTIKKT